MHSRHMQSMMISQSVSLSPNTSQSVYDVVTFLIFNHLTYLLHNPCYYYYSDFLTS